MVDCIATRTAKFKSHSPTSPTASTELAPLMPSTRQASLFLSARPFSPVTKRCLSRLWSRVLLLSLFLTLRTGAQPLLSKSSSRRRHDSHLQILATTSTLPELVMKAAFGEQAPTPSETGPTSSPAPIPIPVETPSSRSATTQLFKKPPPHSVILLLLSVSRLHATRALAATVCPAKSILPSTV